MSSKQAIPVPIYMGDWASPGTHTFKVLGKHRCGRAWERLNSQLKTCSAICGMLGERYFTVCIDPLLS
ncbi:hypothetical protein XELAEV_18022791mg [Xenopus laevis]|uniref:Uncharacterized protein n=1 Tax=Xenopus laevis TaxID=8355 RepID=A0A974D3X7_XENLA|nr:hypothetical protein XELAEV_18022791mg [Xenopus laevis]